MTNKIKFLAILILIPLCFQSCLKEENDIFKESAAERMNNALKKYKSILIDSENGWALEYYPEKNQAYGGYMYVLSFTEDKATVGYERETPANRRTSLYKMAADNGPMLSFDEYNEYMHHFADPNSAAPDGQEGDFEFIVMEASSDHMILKGKKTGNKMPLTRLKETGEEYLIAVKNTASKITLTDFTLVVGEERIQLTKTGSDKVLIYTYEGANQKIEETKIAYIITKEGLKFYQPVTLLNTTMQNFVLSEDGDKLICTDEGVNAYFTGDNIVNFFHNNIDINSRRWTLVDEDGMMSPQIKKEYDKIVKAFEEKKGVLEQISYLYSGKNSADAVSINYKANNKITAGNILFDKEQTEEGVIYTFTNKFDPNGRTFYNDYAGVSEIIELLSGSFKITSVVGLLDPTNVRLTNIADPTIWFTLKLQ